MTTYERRWRAVATLVAVVLLGVGVLEWSLPGVLAGTLAVGLCVALLLGVVATADDRPLPGWRAVALGSGRTAAGLVALWSGLTSSPALTAGVVLVLGLASPWTLRRLGRPAEPAAVVPLPVEGDPPVVSLTALADDDLCLLWRRSFWELSAQRTTAGRLRTVAVRQACLDELERRHAAEVHAWLENGARASGGPEKYLHPTDGGGVDAA